MSVEEYEKLFNASKNVSEADNEWFREDLAAADVLREEEMPYNSTFEQDFAMDEEVDELAQPMDMNAENLELDKGGDYGRMEQKPKETKKWSIPREIKSAGELDATSEDDRYYLEHI